MARRLVDLMVNVLNAEIKQCANFTKFCVNKNSRCKKHTASPTCCTIETGDPNCHQVCEECFMSTLAMLMAVMEASASRALRAPSRRRVAAKKRRRR